MQRTALNAPSDQPVDVDTLLGERAFGGDALFRRALFEGIPLGELGPYPHPYRASADTGR